MNIVSLQPVILTRVEQVRLTQQADYWFRLPNSAEDINASVRKNFILLLILFKFEHFNNE